MTSQTTRIIRYSTQGFKPQYQSEHLKNINYHLNDFNINDFTEHLRYIIQRQHEKHLSFYKEHYQDFQYGIWFFIDGHKNNQSLNHLKNKVPCWEAEIENDVLLYDVNWEYQTTLSDPFGINSGFYLPASQIHKIHNIKHRKMSYFYLQSKIISTLTSNREYYSSSKTQFNGTNFYKT